MTHHNRHQVFAQILNDYPGHSASQQRRRMIAAFEQLGSFTTFEASRQLDVYDPRPRKLELIALGYNIIMVWDTAITEGGEERRIGRYVLKASTGVHP